MWVCMKGGGYQAGWLPSGLPVVTLAVVVPAARPRPAPSSAAAGAAAAGAQPLDAKQQQQQQLMLRRVKEVLSNAPVGRLHAHMTLSTSTTSILSCLSRSRTRANMSCNKVAVPMRACTGACHMVS